MRLARDEEFRRYVVERRSTLLRTATLLAAGDTHLAEDLVQTTLTRLYAAWPAFTAASNPPAYARRVLVNVLIDESRRPWRRQEQSWHEPPDRPQAASEVSEMAEALGQALRELPPRMRAVVVLRYFHEMTVPETANLTGCAQGTVKSQTARGLDKLRQRLGSAATEPADPLEAPPNPAEHGARHLLRSTR